ncbi:MAG TPA: RNA polymerase factor sigma-54 [Gammaproteobacteria bacterium]|nr:RNA polymerase factor sigma-54 [Gammaproteobacteria bacterium]
MLKPSLQLRLSQQLTMTPQLQQAIRLLQLPIMDLRAEIQQALTDNVMLEAEDSGVSEAEPLGEDGSDNDEPEEVAVADDTSWEESQNVGPGDTVRGSSSGDMNFEYEDRSGETLHEHLLWQLELENLEPVTMAIGRAIVDAINDDGYITDEIDVIRATLAPDVLASSEQIADVIGIVQRLDPAGIGARSVSECVLLQLGQFDPATPGLQLAQEIATEHLELVAERQFSILKRQLAATDETLEQALVLVRSCHPRPGSAIYAPAAEYVVPDIFVRRVDGHWIVELNSSLSPQLKVNSTYASSLGRGEEFSVLRTQLQEAKWLIRSLEIRNETLLKVAVNIVDRQKDFFEHGEEHMRPMVLKDIAEAIEMHESTVSRVTTNKYMHTPRGIFEFRYFFSSHVAGDDGEQSSIAVRAKIRKLIAAEQPEKPLSDNQIARLLSDDGVQVARRTVAKYREAMRIPSSSDRRRSNLVG